MPLTIPSYSQGFPGAGLAQYDTMLKELYGKLFENHLHKATETLTFLRSRKGRLGGRRTVEAVVVGRPQSAHQYALEKARLPTPSEGRYVDAEIDSKFAFTRLRETFQVGRLSAGGGRMSFAPSRSQEYKEARETARINAERKLILGQKDPLGVVESHAVVGSTSVVTLDGRDSRTSATPWANGARYLEPRVPLTFIDAAAGAGGPPDPAFEAAGPANEIRVRSIAGQHGTAPVVTLERGNEDNSGADADLTGAPWSFTPADGDLLTNWNTRRTTIGAGAAAFWDFANPYGLHDVFGQTLASHLYGVSKAAFPTFAGRHATNGGVPRPITEMLIVQQSDTTMLEGGGMPIDFALLEHSARRELAALYQPRQEFAPIVSESGFRAVMVINGGEHRIPTINNWLMPVGMIVMGVRTLPGWYSLLEMRPLDENTARRFVPNYAQSEEVYVSAGNWCHMVPNSTVTIDDLIASTQSAPAGGL